MASSGSSSPSPRGNAPRPATTEDRPGARRLGTVLLGAEALCLLLLGGFMITRVGSQDVGASLAIGLAVFILLFAIAVGLAALSLSRRGRFGLGFGVTWQLFQALVAASMLRAAIVVVGGIGMLLAIATFVVLLTLVRATPLPFDDEEVKNGRGPRG